eukprot:CAMPEP_0170503398 /NCGR_PEP_ID=MMETSP0208-20121228/44608_1 /TAXON_ID=197538 /ORGANISM="Strombidium inclinatum, Strain S3" /LENGTH=129 /DNA_ID=CAMNT_0010783037 /DNA_START=518 /DNA_END=907 /DNA_ORIENTATION=-
MTLSLRFITLHLVEQTGQIEEAVDGDGHEELLHGVGSHEVLLEERLGFVCFVSRKRKVNFWCQELLFFEEDDAKLVIDFNPLVVVGDDPDVEQVEGQLEGQVVQHAHYRERVIFVEEDRIAQGPDPQKD